MIASEDFTAADLMDDSGDSALQNDGAIKKDVLALVPVRIIRMGDPQKGQYGPYAIADYELMHSQDGIQDYGQVFVEGRLMRVFQKHFVNHPRKAVQGCFVKSPRLKSDGKRYNGWQFVPPTSEFAYEPDETIIITNM